LKCSFIKISQSLEDATEIDSNEVKKLLNSVDISSGSVTFLSPSKIKWKRRAN